jgi:hypothetical protein
MDAGKFLRLQKMVEAAASSAKESNAVMAAKAMQEAYNRVRGEVRETIPAARQEEFDRLFKSRLGGYGGGPRGEADRFHEAKTTLATLAGWLGGFVEEARLEAEVEAYAKARIKAERGVGFKAPRSS